MYRKRQISHFPINLENIVHVALSFVAIRFSAAGRRTPHPYVWIHAHCVEPYRFLPDAGRRMPDAVPDLRNHPFITKSQISVTNYGLYNWFLCHRGPTCLYTYRKPRLRKYSLLSSYMRHYRQTLL